MPSKKLREWGWGMILLRRYVVLTVVIGFIAFLVACGGGIESATPPVGVITTTANPLVANYQLRSGCAGPAMVEFGPDTNYGRTTAWYNAPGQYASFNIQVAGMRASTTYHMRSVLQCEGNTLMSNDQTFTTGALPPIAFPTLHVSRPSQSVGTENPGIELVNVVETTKNEVQGYYTDRDGNIIWYYDVGASNGNFPYLIKLLPNGHMFIGVGFGGSTAGPGAGTMIREVDLAGNTIREMDVASLDAKMQAAGFNFIPASMHHDVLALDNGHLILLTNFVKPYQDVVGYPGTSQVTVDGLVDLDENWNPVWTWNAADYLDVNRHPFGFPDWTHSNAVIYSPDDGNLIVSSRHQSWVMKIDYNNGAGTGSILWKLGYQGDFALAQGTDPSLWFYSQHYPSLIAHNGQQMDLAVWDNGDARVLDSSGTLCVNNCYSRATHFQVDESTRVASLAWSDTPGLFSIWGGSINQLQNGNVEFDINGLAVPPTGTVVSEVQEVTQTSTPQVVWQMDFDAPSTAYRAYRVPSLYPGVSWAY